MTTIDREVEFKRKDFSVVYDPLSGNKIITHTPTGLWVEVSAEYSIKQAASFLILAAYGDVPVYDTPIGADEKVKPDNLIFN